MATGKMFYITKAPDTCEDFSSSSLDERLDSLGIDYASNVDEITAKQDIQDFANRLMDAGFNIQFPTKEETMAFPDMAFKICSTDVKSRQEMKENYFRRVFANCRKAMEDMTLADFASDSIAVSSLRLKLNNTCGDMVWFNGDSLIDMCYTMDEFIRHMYAGVCYYISKNVVLLH